jgi:hypothetical protein
VAPWLYLGVMARFSMLTRLTGRGASRRAGGILGEQQTLTNWLDVNQKQQLENVAESAEELLRFEFKTSSGVGQKKPHAHDH